MRAASRRRPLVRSLLRAPLRLYEWRLGWLLGHRFLRLTHTGRRSGRRYDTVLEVIARDRTRGEVVVLAGSGGHADWYRNVQADPRVRITLGRHELSATARTLSEDEAWEALAGYERRNRWAAPVVRRVLSWLVGWSYDGSPRARRQLVQELRLVAFCS